IQESVAKLIFRFVPHYLNPSKRQNRSSFLEEVKILKNLKKQFSWIFSCSFRHPTFVTLIF
ncbi:MAG TPA: hypothetical protein K8V64_02330, partial [Enterococcus durans]|nr:hypothetical protein [Enterococcus durans]